MSAGFYHTSGFLYLNMAPQIIFVLLNRMKAQNIDMVKIGSRIISDIVLSMYKTNFIANLLKPQAPIYIPTFYEIFHKIINGSALKLDKPSMEKLFYLILMTIKKQFYLSSSCLEIYSITKTHFDDVIKTLQLLSPNKQAITCLTESLAVFQNFASKLTYLQLHEIRQEILSMLESYHSKIVLFIETGLQKGDSGNLIFKFRHSHNRKSIGKGLNHPDIELKGANAMAKNMDYLTYLDWTTDLGKDDYDNIRGSSKNLGSSKISKSKIKMNQYDEYDGDQKSTEKSLTQFLKLQTSDLSKFQLNLDLFSKQKPANDQQLTSIVANNMKNKSVQQISDIGGKIDKQFEQLKLTDNNEEDQEIDLLDMMDN